MKQLTALQSIFVLLLFGVLLEARVHTLFAAVFALFLSYGYFWLVQPQGLQKYLTWQKKQWILFYLLFFYSLKSIWQEVFNNPTIEKQLFSWQIQKAHYPILWLLVPLFPCLSWQKQTHSRSWQLDLLVESAAHHTLQAKLHQLFTSAK